MVAIGHEELAHDARFAHNPGRVEHQDILDGIIGEWTTRQTSENALGVLDEADVPSGPIYNAKDMLEDPHFNARGLFESVMVGGEPLKIPAIAPKLADTPGTTQWPGPAQVGEHTREVLHDLLGMSAEEIDALEAT